MPAGLIDEKRRVCARRDLNGDFGQVQVHGLRVASGHDEGCTLSVLGADRAEDISQAVRWSVGALGTRAALGPTPGDLVLLADAGLVRPNQTSTAAGSTPFSRPISSRRAGKLF